MFPKRLTMIFIPLALQACATNSYLYTDDKTCDRFMAEGNPTINAEGGVVHNNEQYIGKSADCQNQKRFMPDVIMMSPPETEDSTCSDFEVVGKKLVATCSISKGP